MLLKILEVKKDSYGEELGFEKGDAIVSFNGFAVVDILDYMYYDAQTEFEMQVLTKDGEEVTVEVDKYEDESLGLTFEDDGLNIRTCHNNCIFCFVSQMPKGMRPTLYVKDDDYRQSFLCGNFVTLTNVSDEEIERIIRLNLSPVYVSVQTMNPTLREKMLNNRFAGKIEKQLRRLSEGNIQIHAQIVLVKGVNDGKELDYSIDKLYEIPTVKTVAVVPCGITKFRQGLYPIEDITAEYAREVIQAVNLANQRNGGNLVDLADEFYFKAGVELPPYENYGEFFQIENGIGMSVKFKRDVEEVIKLAKEENKPLLEKGNYITFCGTSVYNFMQEIVQTVQNACEGVQIKLVAIKNEFFGETVNCTGLLTGQDVVNALEEYKGQYETLLVPNPCLMQFEDVFLDGLTFKDLEEKLNLKVKRASITR